jgi:hypothetical protein
LRLRGGRKPVVAAVPVTRARWDDGYLIRRAPLHARKAMKEFLTGMTTAAAIPMGTDYAEAERQS